MASKITTETFKNLRVYKRLTVPLLLNDIACNRLMKLNFVVDKAPDIYRLSTHIIGKGFINAIVNATYCKIFTGGNTVQ